MKNKLLLSIAFTLSIPFSVQADTDLTSAPDGEKLYKKHCAKCHGKEGQANTFRGWLTRAQDLTETKWQSETTDADILKALKDGPKSMPAYEKKLTLEERQAILITIRKF